MGLRSALRLVKNDSDTLKSEYAPAVMQTSTSLLATYEFSAIDLTTALQVPTVSKCSQLICGVIAGIPLKLFSESTGERLPSPLWMKQPDIRQPRIVTMAYTVRSLLFYPVAYWEVTAIYSDDQRPARFAWVENSRVNPHLNAARTEVEYYEVDRAKRPLNGVGSLITFQSPHAGVLATGARTISATTPSWCSVAASRLKSSSSTSR